MKIALVTHTFFPHAVGGREKHVYDLAKTLAKNGHRVEIFTSSDSFKSYKKAKNNLIVHYLPTIQIPMPTGYYRITPTMLFEMLKGNFDLIHAHEYFHFTTFIAALTSKAKNIPLILTEHGYPELVGVSKFLLKMYHVLILPHVIKQTKRFIAVSNFIKEEIIDKFSVSKEEINVVHNGIILDEYKNKSRSFAKKYNLENKKIVLSIGRLVKEKGFQYLMRSIPKVIKEVPNAVFVIVGPSHYYKNELIKLSKELKVEDKVLITGVISDELLKSAIYSSEVFVIPSVYEPFGIIALEAMAYGKPIVSSEIGGLREFLTNNRNCLFVPPANADEISAKIVRLLKDKKLAKKLGINGKRDVKKYDWKNMINEVLKVYNECLNEK